MEDMVVTSSSKGIAGASPSVVGTSLLVELLSVSTIVVVSSAVLIVVVTSASGAKVDVGFVASSSVVGLVGSSETIEVVVSGDIVDTVESDDVWTVLVTGKHSLSVQSPDPSILSVERSISSFNVVELSSVSDVVRVVSDTGSTVVSFGRQSPFKQSFETSVVEVIVVSSLVEVSDTSGTVTVVSSEDNVVLESIVGVMVVLVGKHPVSVQVTIPTVTFVTSISFGVFVDTIVVSGIEGAEVVSASSVDGVLSGPQLPSKQSPEPSASKLVVLVNSTFTVVVLNKSV